LALNLNIYFIMKSFTIVTYLALSIFIVQSVCGQRTQNDYLQKRDNKNSISHISDNVNFQLKNESHMCPPNAFWGQGHGGNAYTSSLQSEYTIYQRFFDINDTIFGIHFWSLQLLHTGSWQQCSSNPMNITIEFYTDRQNLPHLLEYSMDMELVPSATGMYFFNIYPVYEFTAFFEIPIVREKGWFSIKSTQTDCWTILIDTESSTAMGEAYQEKNGNYNPLDNPLAFCFLGNPGSCAYPHALSSQVNDISAVLHWTESGSAESWNVEYGEHGFVQGEGVLVENYSEIQLEIFELIPYTEYDFYVQAVCGSEESFWTGPKYFKTIGCPQYSQCEYEFHMSDEFGDGWNGAVIEVYENGHFVNKVFMSSGMSKVQKVALCNLAEVSLKWVSTSIYDDECALTIKDPLGIPIFSFQFGGAPNDGLLFYAFNVDCNPSCPRPMNLSVQNETFSSALLSWNETGNAEQWQIEWGYHGTDFGYGIRIVTNEPQYLLQGLAAGTYHQFYVRAICEVSDSSIWVGPYVFSTDCHPVSFYPYNEKFTGAFFPPQCWKNVDADGDGYSWERDMNNNFAYEGVYYATSASWHSFAIGALTPDNYLITRKFAIPHPNLALNFWIASLGDISWGINLGMEHYSVMVSTTDNNIESFTPIFSETLTNNIWKQMTFSLADYVGEEIYIAFRHHNCTDMFNLRLDLVSIVSTQDIQEIGVSPSVNLYPNPTTDMLYVSEYANIEIYNSFGQLLGIYEHTVKVDIQHLPAGIYIVKVYNENKSSVRKIQILR